MSDTARPIVIEPHHRHRDAMRGYSMAWHRRQRRPDATATLLHRIRLHSDHESLRRQIEVPTLGYLWGQRVGWFVPRLLNRVYGDGRKLMAVCPLDGRPRYIVVRVDSNTESLTDATAGGESCLIDDIYSAAEEQWGYCHCEECDRDQPERLPFPVAHWGDGSSWSEISWPRPPRGPGRHRRVAIRRPGHVPGRDAGGAERAHAALPESA